MTEMMEYMECRLADGFTTEAALDARKPVTDCAGSRPGFQCRRFARREDGVWMDRVFWADAGTMEAAMADFMPSGCGKALLPMMVEGGFSSRGIPVHLAGASGRARRRRGGLRRPACAAPTACPNGSRVCAAGGWR